MKRECVRQRCLYGGLSALLRLIVVLAASAWLISFPAAGFAADKVPFAASRASETPLLVKFLPVLEGLPDYPLTTAPEGTCLDTLDCPFGASLLELIRYAAVSSPEIARSVAELRRAEAGFREARWGFGPIPEVYVDHDFEDDADNLVLGIDQPLWTGGKLSAALESARQRVVSAQYAVKSAQFQVAQQLIEVYGDWLSAWYRFEAWEEGVAAHDDLVSLVRRRVDGGASGLSELQLAENRRSNIITEVIGARAARELALTRLEQLLGQRPKDADMVAVLASPYAGVLETPIDLKRALAGHPSLLRAGSELAVAESEAKGSRAGIYPTLALRYEYQRQNAFTGDATGDSITSLRFTSNFGSGLSKLARIDQADAGVAVAEEACIGLRRAVVEQLGSTRALLETALLRTRTLEPMVVGSEEIFQAYQRQFSSGRRSWMDVMNSAREVADNKATLADARATLVMTSWKLALYAFGLDNLGGSAGQETVDGRRNHHE